jgi:hypothetical protein
MRAACIVARLKVNRTSSRFPERLMFDKRKGRCRHLRYTGWISLGAEELCGCIIYDISDSRARLRVEKADEIPDEFVLLLSARAKPRRARYVVWRTAGEIGCQFDRPLSAQEKTRPILKAEEMTPSLPMPEENAGAGQPSSTAADEKEPA